MSRKVQRLKDAERKLNEAYRWMLAAPEGRLVLRHMIQESGLLAPSCAPNGGSFTSGSETFYREGKRAMGLGLVAKLTEVNPHAYAALAAESAKEQADAIAEKPAPPEDEE